MCILGTSADLVSAVTYTFSTIAQALAGAVALLGAFALYRLQTIDQQMFNLGRHLLDSFSDRSDIVDDFYHGRYETFIPSVDAHERTHSWAANQKHNWTRFNRLKQLYGSRTRLIPSLKTSIWLSLYTMGASVAALSLVSKIVADCRLATGCLSAGVLLFVVCLFWYFRLIKSMIE